MYKIIQKNLEGGNVVIMKEWKKTLYALSILGLVGLLAVIAILAGAWFATY